MSDVGAPASAEVSAGLDSVMDKVAVGHGYAQLFGGYDKDDGAYARAELDYRIRQNLGAFAFGEASTVNGAVAGAGLRLTF